MKSSCGTYSMKKIPISKFLNPLFTLLVTPKYCQKTTNDFLLIKDFAFSSAIYRLTKKNVSIEECASSFSLSKY